MGKETGLTSYIERFNNTLRQRVSRLVRKTLSFSKNVNNHIAAIWNFITTMHNGDAQGHEVNFFSLSFPKYHYRNLVFIDETGMPLGFTRLYGRAPRGERLYDTEAPGKSGQNISLMGASAWMA